MSVRRYFLEINIEDLQHNQVVGAVKIQNPFIH